MYGTAIWPGLLKELPIHLHIPGSEKTTVRATQGRSTAHGLSCYQIRGPTEAVNGDPPTSRGALLV